MRTLPDPHEYMKQRLQDAAQRDAERLRMAELTPNETLTQALSERALQEAINSYMQEASGTLEHNIRWIVRDERKRIRQIERRTTRISITVFSLIALCCAAIAGFDFAQHAPLMGVVFIAGAVLAMATLGALINR